MPITIKSANMKYRDPSSGDYVDVSAISGETTEIIAPDYSELTFPITAGKHCVYEGGYYEANQDINTSEVWTPGHWSPLTVGEEIEDVKSALNQKYEKPATGIPSTDLASAVQISLGKADTAYQKPNSGIPAADIESGVIPVTDVRVNGLSVVSGGIANVPVATDSQVANAVTDWLDENIPTGETVVVDASLSVSGAAADAAKTGGVVNSISKTTRNLFDDSIIASADGITIGNDGYYSGKSSKWVSDFASSFPIDGGFKSNTRYTVSLKYYFTDVGDWTGNASALKVFYTDQTSGNLIAFSAEKSSSFYTSVTTSNNKTVDHIEFVSLDYRGNNYILHISEIQIEEGTDATEYVKHRSACDDVARALISLVEVDTKKTKEDVEGTLDKIDLTWEIGYINVSTGANQNANVTIRSTDFILLSQKDKTYIDYGYMYRLYRYTKESVDTYQAFYDYNYDSTLHYITGYYEVPETGYYRIVVAKLDESTIISSDIKTVSGSLHLIRNSNANKLSEDVSLNILPYNLTALKTYIDSLMNTKADLMIPIVTDIHGGYQDTYPVINYLANSGIGNYFFELGDVINSTFETRAASIAYLRESFRSMAYTKTNTPIIMLQGNHDTNPLSGTDTSKNVTQEAFYALSMARAKGYNQPANKAYGYVDIDAAKVRIIWLNTSDIYDSSTGDALVTGQYTMIQQAQIEWFVNTALNFMDKATPTDWSVIIASHDSLSQVAGSTFINILTAFMNGTSASGSQTVAVGTYNNIINYSCDFTQQGGLTVICEVNGHHHKDMVRELGSTGIMQVYIACEGNASASYDNNGETAYYTRRRGTSDEHLIDTLVLDKSSRKVYFKRFGIGEDRQISY